MSKETEDSYARIFGKGSNHTNVTHEMLYKAHGDHDRISDGKISDRVAKDLTNILRDLNSKK